MNIKPKSLVIVYIRPCVFLFGYFVSYPFMANIFLKLNLIDEKYFNES